MPAKVDRIEVTCATCGKAKSILITKFVPGQRYFCDRNCQGQWKSKNVVKSSHHSWTSVKVNCAFCGKEKYVNLARFEKTKDFFCNIQCQANWRKEHWKGKDCPLSVEKIEVHCAWCGKSKLVTPYIFALSSHFFCGRECQGLYKSVFESKDKHGRWKGGKSYEPYGLGFDSRLKHQIKRRDNYTCQLCGVKGENGILHVHHIDYDKENNDPVNLVTLCNSCHSATNSNRESWWFYFINKK